MKADLHPAVHPVVFVDSSNGTEFVTFSTLKSDKTKKIKGVDHFVIAIDISSSSHPFYTGKAKFLDTAGRIDKFKSKYDKFKKKAAPVAEVAPVAEETPKVEAEASKKEE